MFSGQTSLVCVWPADPNVPKPQQGLISIKCSSKVDYILVAGVTDGNLKLIAEATNAFDFIEPVSTLHLTCLSLSPHPLPPQVYPLREIHHLGEFLPLHLGLQSIDFGRTISDAEQGEAPAG